MYSCHVYHGHCRLLEWINGRSVQRRESAKITNQKRHTDGQPILRSEITKVLKQTKDRQSCWTGWNSNRDAPCSRRLFWEEKITRLQNCCSLQLRWNSRLPCNAKETGSNIVRNTSNNQLHEPFCQDNPSSANKQGTQSHLFRHRSGAVRLC